MAALITRLITDVKFGIRNSKPATRRGDWGVRLRPAAFAVRTWLALILSLAVLMSGRAQSPLSNLVFTVGTTARDPSSNDWSYVVLGSPAPATLVGKTFAVFGKPGYPTNVGTFTARGSIAPATDLATINTRLNQSVALGQDLNTLNDAFARVVGTNVIGLLRKVPGIAGQSLAQRVLTARQLAATDLAVAAGLALLERGNPGLQLCAGRAFSDALPTTTTYEVRETNPLTGDAGDVVGRVTLVPNAPVILPAPGQAFQVMTNDPSDHLRIRLRWGTPPELRRVSLLNFGFNVWRIPRAAGEAGNFHLTPPTIAQLHSNPNFSRANVNTAVRASKDFTTGSGAGAADDPADRTTFFFGDTGRATLGTIFNDGQEFSYFITARDLLGRDGFASPGRLARACRRELPSPPSSLHVENTVLPGSTNQSRLLVVWEQNTNATDAVSEYWIYRWTNAAAALTNDVAPYSNRVGVVAQALGTNFGYFLDNSAGALTAANSSNVWYTARAVSQAACDPLLSGQAGPAWGVLRERGAPDATDGEILGSCGAPIVKLTAVTTNSLGFTNTEGPRSRIIITRRDPGIEWANLFLGYGSSYGGKIYFPPDGDRIEIEHAEPVAPTLNFAVYCSVGNNAGVESAPVLFTRTNFYANTNELQIEFLAGQLLASALSSSDPLLNSVNCNSASSAVADASGMVAVQIGQFGPLTTALIQAQTNNGWVDVGLYTSDSNGVFWISYPACLVGPVPPFRGCQVNLTTSDCDQHVAASADGSPTAPLRVRFRLKPRTREYRVYRRVDGGPMTLFAQGAAVYDPAKPGKLIETKDEAMPAVAARLCYFVQLLDEHGNGGPLSFIGCKFVKPPKLPVPTLSEPAATGTVNNPQVALNWFCPTSGVYRFQVKLQVADSQGGSQASGFLSTRLTRDFTFDTSAVYAGLTPARSAISTFSNLKISLAKLLLNFDEAHLTSPIGASFGPGPQFTLTASVRANTSYKISVAAVDEQGHVGPSSTAWDFTWRPPIALQTVPWPARPLPHVENPPGGPGLFFGFGAFVINDTNLFPKYPVGVAIGGSTTTGLIYSYGITNGDYLPVQPPTRALYQDSRGQVALPCVLYRLQVTNALFPRVSGDITQVSPLIESIAWKNPCLSGTFDGPCTASLIRDPLIRVNYFTFLILGTDSFGYGYNLVLLDTQPVISGARYRYFLVHFDSKREPDVIYPCGDVDIP